MAQKAASKSAPKSARKKAPKNAGSGKHLSALTRHLKDAILPGDTGFAPKALKEAASFLLSAAQKRSKNRSVLALESIKDTGPDGRLMLRIAIINDDMPFLVDSLAATIASQGLSIERLVHPVVSVTRNAGGTLTQLNPKPAKDAARESMIYIETERVDARQRREIERHLRVTLGDVRAAVKDWPKVQAAMESDADAMGAQKTSALLHWFNQGMLTQLGHLTRDKKGNVTGALGICRKSSTHLLADASYTRAFDWFAEDSARELLIVKANTIANVHRRVPLDLLIVPVKTGGNITALSVHAGVWTSAALASPPTQVPLLRGHLDGITQQLGFDPAGHAGKALLHALTAMPHDLLLGLAQEDIARLATAMMGLVDRPRPRLAMVQAPLKRHLFAFVWLPRDMLSTQVREGIEAMLTGSTGAQMLDWSLEVEGGNLAMLRFVLDIRQASILPDAADLEAQLLDLLRGWSEAVERELAKSEEPSRAAALASRYAEAFPAGYRATYRPRDAAIDIRRLRTLATNAAQNAARGRDARLFGLPGDAPHELHLTIYQHSGELNLSDAVPVLENFGFRVLTQAATLLDEGNLGEIHDFSLALPRGQKAADLLERADALESAIAAVLNGEAENGPFNLLVVGVGLAAGEANWLRAFYRYLRQTGMSFNIYTVVDALAAAPAVTKALVALFTAQHDPAFKGKRADAANAARKALKSGLAKVSAINDDRLLRLYAALIEAILRTNAFAPAAEEALAFKIESANVPGLPKPLPWREIFVYSPRVEGIHLRSGPIARGGLRWSDRRDDFRTEILGLMKAQRVKNAVIVPAGAKGGFYPKQLPNPAHDRDAWAAEGQASYELFIRTLLSVTDNLKCGKTIHPPQTVIHDGEDPYFVVAADKGTARFSDVANAIAEDRGFWLGDAFASGGSNGYDHKAMGITARGAWVSVQRHFLERGVDVQNDPVRVVGCGDMSGDVFGNGMLLSKSIKLVAAFDHRHIFIDPDPDPATSWKERKRLYDLPRSSWADYSAKLMSKGGGIYPRDAKSISLSKAAREALGVTESEFEPEALIAAILKSPVDLIWFGGIGTYIKASSENNAAVGDPGNDTLRVSANELRAAAIGEGANLGITQAGRIEFALLGGRINTDFIDNSAGVDCSDNEVNIKIALQAALQSGKLSSKKRNNLLETMTDDVADIVLEDNRLQALALSIAEAGGADDTGPYLRLMETLEEGGALDRSTEGLADNEAFTRRAAEGSGLVRPELSVLLSSTKLVLQDAIEASALPEDAGLEDALIASFPAAMRKAYAAQIKSHRLRREMIATELANRIVNRLGLLPPFELAEEESVPLDYVASAFVAVDGLFDVAAIWRMLETAKMPEPARILMFEKVAIATRGQMADVLRLGAGKRAPSDLIAELSSGMAELRKGRDVLLTGEAREQSTKMQEQFTAAGAPANVAEAVAALFELDGSAGLASLAKDAGISPTKLTGAFGALGMQLGLDWAQGTAALMEPSDVWERLLVAGLARDFQHMRLDFLRKLLRGKAKKADPAKAVESWAGENAVAISQFRSMVARAEAQPDVAPSMLAQIASQARNLLER
ncbi:MAG: NAD-glutamate dehydrogenase domain-containing protein [Erythrobacter sp.]